MKTIKNILLSILLLNSCTIFAQQESIISLYRYHMNIINPAYAGVDNETILTSSLRKQWTGIADAPATQAVSFGTSLTKKFGIGLSVISDQTFVERQTTVGIDFSYKVQFSENTNVYFGLKAGGNFYSVNSSGLETYNVIQDGSLTSISNFNPNVGAGVLLKQEKWFVSFSIPKILSTKRARNEDGIATIATDSPHLYLSTGYDFNLDNTDYLVLKPSFLVRYVNGAPVSADINTMLAVDKQFEIGATYRTDQAYAALVTVTLSKRFQFGYVYEMSTQSQLASARNTNEFLLRFKF